MSKQQIEVNRYDFIDALRGIAILLVVLTHITMIVNPSLPFLRLVAINSMFGVQLFYIVSALTLFLSADQREWVEARPTTNFFIRRFFRIAPLFYLAIIAYTLNYGTGPNYWAPDGIHWWQFLLTFLFLNGWHPEAINAIVTLGWSIAVEMTFYPLIPLLHKRLKGVGPTLVFIIASQLLQMLLGVVYKPFLTQYFPSNLVENYFYLWFFAQLPIFGLGMLTYQILRGGELKPNQSLGNALVFAAAFLFVAFLAPRSYLDLIPIYVFYGLAFVALTLGLYFHPNKLLVNPFTRWIGKISYSLYLVHYLVVPQVKRWVHLSPAIGKTAQFGIYFLIVLTISSAIAYLTYRLIEVPGMNLGKRLIRKLEERAA